MLRLECPLTTDFGYALHKKGGFCGSIARGRLFVRTDYAGTADFVHGLHTEGFVYVNVLCVVVVLVIVVVNVL
jgi:hypothetical protein